MSDTDPRTKLFEQIGLQQKLFSRPDLQSALQLSKQRGQKVGDVLVEQGTLTREQLRGLDRAVTYRVGRDEDKEIAKIIVDSSYCDPASVEAALKRQKDFYSKTGELVRLGTLLVEGQELTESQKIAAHKIHRIEQQASAPNKGP